MRKLIKRIIALALIAVFFTAPSTALAATPTTQSSSTPVLVTWGDGLKVYQYQPNPYYLPGNQTLNLSDISRGDNKWLVPAGNTMIYNVVLSDKGSFRIDVYDNYSRIYSQQVIDMAWHDFTLPASSSDTTYTILITSYSNISVEMYLGAYSPE